MNRVAKSSQKAENLSVWNTFDTWLDQFPFWSKSTLERTTKSLSDLGLVNIDKVYHQSKRMNAYAIESDQLTHFQKNRLSFSRKLPEKYYVFPRLAQVLSLPAAIVLSIIHCDQNYFSTHPQYTMKGDTWVPYSYESLQAKIPFFSRGKIIRLLKDLEEKGILLTQRRDKNNRCRRRWYCISKEALSKRGVSIQDYRSSRSIGTDSPLCMSLNLACQVGVNEALFMGQLLYWSTIKKQKQDQQETPLATRQNGQIQSVKMGRSIYNDLDTTKDMSIDKTHDLKEEEIDTPTKHYLNKTDQHKARQLSHLWNQKIQRKIDQNPSPQKISAFQLRKLEALFVPLSQFFGKKETEAEIYSQYFDLITTSSFLMGQKTKFHIYMGWAFQESTCQKILKGEYDTQINQVVNRRDRHAEQVNQKIVSSFKQNEEDRLTQLFRKEIYSVLSEKEWEGEMKYASWFASTQLQQVDEHKYVLAFDTRFKEDYSLEKFSRFIYQSLLNIDGNVKEIKLHLSGKHVEPF